jgi:zinc transport system ATP-binding protein
MSSLITLKNIGVTFHQRAVLDDVSFTLSRDEITTLIGPNGAGKSTLVKVLTGLQTPTTGTIEKKKKLIIGYVPQKLQLNPSLPLTVARFLSLSNKHNHQHQMESLTLVQGEHLQKHNMHTLSGGELQRVLLARAILRKPDLLILDEPVQGVDVKGQIALYALIENLQKTFHCGIFMVSHDLHVVMASTHRVICLQHRICCSGKPEQIAHHPAYIHLFGQQCAENMAIYPHHHKHHSHENELYA